MSCLAGQRPSKHKWNSPPRRDTRSQNTQSKTVGPERVKKVYEEKFIVSKSCKNQCGSHINTQNMIILDKSKYVQFRTACIRVGHAVPSFPSSDGPLSLVNVAVSAAEV